MNIQMGIDTCCFYLTLSPKQKKNILKKMKAHSGFRTIQSDYFDETYEYSSDLFAKQGLKLKILRKKKSVWGLFVLIHPALLLGNDDPIALYQPTKKSYRNMVETADKLLEDLAVPCSLEKMKLTRLDVTANLIFSEQSRVEAYLHVVKKGLLLPHYHLERFREDAGGAKNCKEANRHSYKQACSSASFFVYDKTAQLEMIERFPQTMIGKKVLRLEAQLRRKAMKKWVEKDMDTWRILKKIGNEPLKVIRWYLNRMKLLSGAFLRYEDAVEQIQLIKGKKTRTRMLYLLRKTSDSDNLSNALKKLQNEYDLKNHQADRVLKKLQKLGISPITLPNNSEIESLEPLSDLLEENLY